VPYKILVVNPGSTSTKIALYEDERPLFTKTIDHQADLDRFDEILDQLEYRTGLVKQAAAEWQVDLKELSAVVGRGGMLLHMKGGGYLVEEHMIGALKSGKASPHASNLGALIAHEIAQPLGIPAYIYDSVTADELAPIAQITGIPGVKRESQSHVLNAKAVGRKYAASVGKTYEELTLIVVHMGGGVTVGVHDRGRIVDCIRDDAGPFSPERAGSVPLLYLVDMCYSGKYEKKEMIRKLRGLGGMKGYLGTSDAREIERRIAAGDEFAKTIYEAQAYQIAKGIALMSPALCGHCDAVILTGGLAHSRFLVEKTKEYIGWIAPVAVLPGEFEMEALALGGLRILRGEEGVRSLERSVPGGQ